MARKKKHKGSTKLPIVSVGILLGQAALAAAESGGSVLVGADSFQSLYTGFKFSEGGAFHPERLAMGYGPWVVKRFVLPIARPRIGGVRLPVSLS